MRVRASWGSRELGLVRCVLGLARASWGRRELGRCKVRASVMAMVRVGARLGLAREGGGVGKEAREERHVDKVLHATQVKEPERTEGHCAPRSVNGPDTAGAAKAKRLMIGRG